ncbi:MAG: hypothetical protein ACD_37C00234G0007 [uncultured bacterium]|nr:MAG: hypothetical protein ACD_37C00234G0007 [uncultured bacterium]
MENIIWIVLGVIAIILLVIYWRGKNAIWGGLTIGIIIGLLISILPEFNWSVVWKSAILGIFVGFGAESLGKIFDKKLTKKF